tara:strand:+ start:134 stop:418 length:285 start_codon:yes stop_codon:yes gene_type:complete
VQVEEHLVVHHQLPLFQEVQVVGPVVMFLVEVVQEIFLQLVQHKVNLEAVPVQVFQLLEPEAAVEQVLQEVVDQAQVEDPEEMAQEQQLIQQLQ